MKQISFTYVKRAMPFNGIALHKFRIIILFLQELLQRIRKLFYYRLMQFLPAIAPEISNPQSGFTIFPDTYCLPCDLLYRIDCTFALDSFGQVPTKVFAALGCFLSETANALKSKLFSLITSLRLIRYVALQLRSSAAFAAVVAKNATSE